VAHSDVAQYGLSPSTKVNTSRFGTLGVDSPTLNISAYWIPDDYISSLGFKDAFAQLGYMGQNLKLSDPGRRTWSADNQTYGLLNIKKQGRCQALKVYIS
jgi:hypothetical protein